MTIDHAPRRLRQTLGIAVSLWLWASAPAPAAELYGVEGVEARVLELLPLGPTVLSLAVSTDGQRAALALAGTAGDAEGGKARSTLLVVDASTGEPASLVLDGLNRDLLFPPDGTRLFALQYLPGRRGPAETELVDIDPRTLTKRRTIPVGVEACGLAYWAERAALVVIGGDEIRTLRLSDLHSGPLFRVPGGNLSAAALGGSLFLLGREDGLALVDLDDPPEDYATPVRERASAPAVSQLVASQDATRIVARSQAADVFEVELDPDLAMGAVLGPGWIARRAWPDQVPPRARAVDPDLPLAPTGEPAEPAPPAQPTPAETTPAEPTPAEPTPAETSALPSTDPWPSVPGLGGILSGPGAGEVVAVVLFGPDNILREAARVAPAAGGRWQVIGLTAGRYRIQLDGGGGRVLESEPRFHSAVVDEGQSNFALSFHVLRSH